MAVGIATCWPHWLQCHLALTGKELVGKYQRQTWPQREQSETFTTVLSLLLFSTSIKKPQPLVETPRAIQTPVPSSGRPPAGAPMRSPVPRAWPAHLLSPSQALAPAGDLFFPFPANIWLSCGEAEPAWSGAFSLRVLRQG